MSYSTFTEMGYGPSRFDRLEFALQGAGKTQPVYVLATSIEDYSLEEVREKMQGVEGIYDTREVNGTVDLIVKGRENAEKVAKELFRRTLSPVSVVQYAGQSMGELYVNLRETLDLARKERSYHFYDPEKDSLEAMLKADLAK